MDPAGVIKLEIANSETIEHFLYVPQAARAEKMKKFGNEGRRRGGCSPDSGRNTQSHEGKMKMASLLTLRIPREQTGIRGTECGGFTDIPLINSERGTRRPKGPLAARR